MLPCCPDLCGKAVFLTQNMVGLVAANIRCTTLQYVRLLAVLAISGTSWIAEAPEPTTTR